MKVSGTGEVFLADQAQDVHLLRLADDRITCNGRNVLAFDADIDWDIKRVQGGAAGALAGGLFNMTLAGSGLVAVVTDGPPVLLDIGSAPTFADAQAAVAWSAGVVTSLKTDVNLKTLIGRGSGETFQLGFSVGAGCWSSPARARWSARVERGPRHRRAHPRRDRGSTDWVTWLPRLSEDVRGATTTYAPAVKPSSASRRSPQWSTRWATSADKTRLRHRRGGEVSHRHCRQRTRI